MLLKYLKLTLLTLSLVATQPAIAQSYDDIANAHDAPETYYGSTKGWKVYAGYRLGKLRYCVAETSEYGTKIRIGVGAGSSAGQWQVALPYPSKPNWNGAMEIDGDRRSASGTAIGKWTVVWLGLDELDRLKNGNTAIFDIGRASLDYSLNGSSAAILKVKECIARGGSPRKAKKKRTYAPTKRTTAPQKQRTIRASSNRCPRIGSVASPASNQGTRIEFQYEIASGIAAQIYWIDFQGNPVSYATFSGAPVVIDTSVGHVWIVKDFSGKFYGGVHRARSGHTVIVVR